MAGRHRASTPSRARPIAIGTIATAAVGTSFWLASSVGADADERVILPATTTDSSLVLSPSSTTTSPAPSSTPRATPTTTRRTTTTTTPSPTTTTRTTTRRSPKPTPTRRTHRPTTPPPPPCSTTLDGTQPHVAQVGNHLLGKFDVRYVIGRAARSGTSDHPSGLAVDFMVSTPTGNALADYVLRNKARFGVKYVIWRQRYNDGSGWSYMEDRGSTTANHYDHVHVSFHSDADVDVTC